MFLGNRVDRKVPSLAGHPERIGHQIARRGAQWCLLPSTALRCAAVFPLLPRDGRLSLIAGNYHQFRAVKFVHCLGCCFGNNTGKQASCLGTTCFPSAPTELWGKI